MKLHFVKAHALSKLHDELLRAGFRPVRVEGTPDGSEGWLTFEGAVDEAAVRAVIDAHDPTPPPRPPTVEERVRKLEDVAQKPDLPNPKIWQEIQALKDRLRAAGIP